MGSIARPSNEFAFEDGVERELFDLECRLSSFKLSPINSSYLRIKTQGEEESTDRERRGLLAGEGLEAESKAWGKRGET